MPLPRHRRSEAARARRKLRYLFKDTSGTSDAATHVLWPVNCEGLAVDSGPPPGLCSCGYLDAASSTVVHSSAAKVDLPVPGGTDVAATPVLEQMLELIVGRLDLLDHRIDQLTLAICRCPFPQQIVVPADASADANLGRPVASDAEIQTDNELSCGTLGAAIADPGLEIVKAFGTLDAAKQEVEDVSSGTLGAATAVPGLVAVRKTVTFNVPAICGTLDAAKQDDEDVVCEPSSGILGAATAAPGLEAVKKTVTLREDRAWRCEVPASGGTSDAAKQDDEDVALCSHVVECEDEPVVLGGTLAEQIVAEVTQIYLVHNPCMLDRMLQRLKTELVGQELKPYVKICEKYGISPRTFA